MCVVNNTKPQASIFHGQEPPSLTNVPNLFSTPHDLVPRGREHGVSDPAGVGGRAGARAISERRVDTAVIRVFLVVAALKALADGASQGLDGAHVIEPVIVGFAIRALRIATR